MLSHAVVPLRPSTPRRMLILAMSAVFGLLASLAIVLGREMQGDGFRTARELEAATGHPVLAQIPEMPLKGANVGECHELCVSGLAHAGFRYSHALKRSSNIMAK
ncbi:GNVR domain-containing protein [Sulfitobacter faviae]|uniref:GNVR domain-containing protein n=1 Tax=Sulfitobacter faviae TaxID=1775881 RepID=UPI00398CD09D